MKRSGRQLPTQAAPPAFRVSFDSGSLRLKRYSWAAGYRRSVLAQFGSCRLVTAYKQRELPAQREQACASRYGACEMGWDEWRATAEIPSRQVLRVLRVRYSASTPKPQSKPVTPTAVPLHSGGDVQQTRPFSLPQVSLVCILCSRAPAVESSGVWTARRAFAASEILPHSVGRMGQKTATPAPDW